MTAPLTAASTPATPVPAPTPVPAVALYDVDPDAVAALVLACPAVAGLSGGPFGAAATYLPGRRVAGVRISPDTVEVHVVARYGPTAGELARQVRAALAGRVLGRSVDIVVEDLEDPAPPTVATAAGTPGALAGPAPGTVPGGAVASAGAAGRQNGIATAAVDPLPGGPMPTDRWT